MKVKIDHLKLQLCLLLLFQFSGNTLASYSSRPLCHPDDSSALLQLKQTFSRDEKTQSHPKLKFWVPETDCCDWNGVTCDELTGHVIGLDLSRAMLSGNIDSSNSLFHLSYLQRLNLTGNFFNYSRIPSGIHRLPQLTHLDLSQAGFVGQIPVEITHLTGLVSLKLTGSSKTHKAWMLKFPNITMLVQSLSNLRELCLEGVEFLDQEKDWSNILSSALPRLQVLSLSNCLLEGSVSSLLLSHHSLTHLDLHGNPISFIDPEFSTNISSLRYLNLYRCNLSATTFIARIFQISSLRMLDLSDNPYLRGNLLDFPSNSSLQELVIARTRFSGTVPASFGNLTQLVHLDLSDNNFSGLLPPLPFLSIETIDMSHNHFTGQIPSAIFELSSLKWLDLSQNRFVGQLEEFINAASALVHIDLSGNQLKGHIPTSFFRLTGLFELSLTSNNFSGTLEPHLFQNLKNLSLLDFSHNSFLTINTSSSIPMLPHFATFAMSSCNLTELPIFLRTQETLMKVDLSDNRIHGLIPKWIWKTRLSELNLSYNLLSELEQPFSDLSLSSLGILDLRFNMLRGSLLNFPPSIKFASISNNKFYGEIPVIVCNLSNALVLDLSNNNLSGLIPPCLGNFSSTLKVLNLRGNSFHGTMMQTFSRDCSLETIDFSSNHLSGQLPRSLVNCTKLKVLNLGHNQIYDSFPLFLGKLSEFLVLILRYNNFYGDMGHPAVGSAFPQLHIIDVSNNNFIGTVAKEYFIGCSAMENVDEQKYKLDYLGNAYYHDSISVTYKGTDIEFKKIVTLFTTIDYSNNRFEGEIPEEIGNLNGLRGLNISQNLFVGPIPSTIGKIQPLESLDLSQNMFSGKIPSELNNLTSLSVMNLSFNQLVGEVPRGSQLQTFSNASYMGNPGLCGFPLSRRCSQNIINGTPPQQQLLVESESEFDWKFMLAGYGSGAVIGLILGYLLFWRLGYCFEGSTRNQGWRKRKERMKQARRR